MDYVVAGLGFGAILVVAGFALRDVGLLLWRVPGDPDADTTVLTRGKRLTLLHALSNGLTVAGGFVLLATIAAVAAGVGDATGGLIVAAACALAAIFAAVVAGIAVRAYVAVGGGLAPVIRSVPAQTSFSTADAGALTSVRRLPKPAAMAAEPPALDRAAEDAAIAAFDPTRLLADEVAHEDADDQAQVAATESVTGIDPEPITEAAQPPLVDPAMAVVEAEPPPMAAEASTAAPVALVVEQPPEVETEAAVEQPAIETPADPEPSPIEAGPSTLVEMPQPNAELPPPVPLFPSGGTDEVLSVTIRPTSRPFTPPPAAALQPTEPTAPQLAPALATNGSTVPTGESAFQSRLLADIGAAAPDADGAAFASGLLADVDSGSAAGGFRSPLLADLASPSADGIEADGVGAQMDGKRKPRFGRLHRR